MAILNRKKPSKAVTPAEPAQIKPQSTPAPYRHVPQHAASDAMSNAPPTSSSASSKRSTQSPPESLRRQNSNRSLRTNHTGDSSTSSNDQWTTWTSEQRRNHPVFQNMPTRIVETPEPFRMVETPEPSRIIETTSVDSDATSLYSIPEVSTEWQTYTFTKPPSAVGSSISSRITSTSSTSSASASLPPPPPPPPQLASPPSSSPRTRQMPIQVPQYDNPAPLRLTSNVYTMPPPRPRVLKENRLFKELAVDPRFQTIKMPGPGTKRRERPVIAAH